MNSKKWILTTLSMSIILILVLSLLTYVIDPFYQYHYAEDGYPVNPRYAIPGLIKNYDYDSVLIGSSMTQNFDSQEFKDKLDLDILKVNLGGMNVPDIHLNMDLIQKTGKCKTMFIGIDLHKFAEESPETHFPEYLYDGYWNDYKYLLSSDVYTRFLPLSLAVKGLEALGKPVPSMLASKSDIHTMGYWNDDFKFGEKAVLNTIVKKTNQVSTLNTQYMANRLKYNIDEFYKKLDHETEYIMFFPPYSAFYWTNCENNGYLNVFFDAKKYFYELSQKHKNIQVYDFQNIDETIDLSYYKDTTHYSKDINSYMVDCFSTKKFLVESSETIEANCIGITEKSNYIKEKYKDFIF